MSAGHHDAAHPIDAERSHQLQQLLNDPKFAAAVAAYRKTDTSRDIPFLGGSNNAGDTIFLDRRFNEAVKRGEVKYDGKPYDPRPFVKVHEAVEGALIRLLGWRYVKAHDLATIAERHAVEHAGRTWGKHQAALKPWIRADEKEDVPNPPPDLLTVPYKGTPQDREVEPKGGYVSSADADVDRPAAERPADEASAAKPSQKITRDAFLYLEPKAPNPEFAQCSSCQFRIGGALICGMMGGRKVEAIGTCGMYAEGNGVRAILARMTPDEIGYTVRKVRCENCFFGGSPTCGLFDGLNKESPELFDLDVRIKPQACCNANSPK